MWSYHPIGATWASGLDCGGVLSLGEDGEGIDNGEPQCWGRARLVRPAMANNERQLVG